MPKKMYDRTRLAIGFCAGMLIVCLLVLMQYLAPVLQGSALPDAEGAAFGMVLIDITDEQTADSYHVKDCGVYVLAVQAQSPAALAGVSSGDMLLNVNAVPVLNTGEFVFLQESFVQGEQVQMAFQRGSSGTAYAVTLLWNEE